MKRVATRSGKSTLAVVVITCAILFLVFGIMGSIGFVFSNGVQKLRDFDWSGFHVGIGKDFTVDTTKSTPLEGIDRIVIETVAADVQVVPGTDEVIANLKGTCRTFSTPVNLEVTTSGSTLHIKVRYPTGSTSSSLDLNVEIPSEYSGDLQVTGVSSRIAIDGVDFPCKHLKLSTVSGDVTVSGLGAESYDVSTTSGRSELSGVTGSFIGHSVSGNFNIDMTKVFHFEADTVSGDVELALPTGSDFVFTFSTVSGSFQNDFAAVLDKNTRTSMKGTVGDGTTGVSTTTVSGGFSIHKS